MVRISTGVRNAILAGLGLQGILNKGFIEIRSGTQPTSGDAATTGTLLGIVSEDGDTPGYETVASGSITLTGGASGSINTVTVGGLNIIPDGAVPFNSTLNQTASDLCDAINRNGMFTATVSGAVVTIRPRPGAGAAFNSAAVSSSLTTITTSHSNMASGVAAANGLLLLPPSAGFIAKPAYQTYRFIGLAAGTAGYFRQIGAAGDAGLLQSGAPWLPRIDGSIAASGGDASMSNLTVAVGVPNTIDIWQYTMPAS